MDDRSKNLLLRLLAGNIIAATVFGWFSSPREFLASWECFASLSVLNLIITIRNLTPKSTIAFSFAVATGVSAVVSAAELAYLKQQDMPKIVPFELLTLLVLVSLLTIATAVGSQLKRIEKLNMKAL